MQPAALEPVEGKLPPPPKGMRHART
jgi:hypothetical protein